MCTNRADDVVKTILVDVDNATTVTICLAHVRLTPLYNVAEPT